APMLPASAQEVIGQARPASQMVYDTLMGEGVESDTYIDLFDGGPVVQARPGALHTVHASPTPSLRIGQSLGPTGSWRVANAQVRDFRACLIPLGWNPGEPVILDAQLAQLLNVTEGDSLRLIGGA